MIERKHLFFLALSALVSPLVTLVINNKTSAQSLEIFDEDYENGETRFAAIQKKVAPGLKERFEEKELVWGSPIFIRAFKKERQLELWVKKGGKFLLFESYFIAGTSGGLGPKLRQGDGQIPEGFYFVTPRQMNPRSNFHLSFNIGYPNQFDREYKRTGDFIMVHGATFSAGCMAMTNAKVEEIYTIADAAFKGGQKFFRIHIFPFKMTDEALRQKSDHRWAAFWGNLQKGYQYFEDTKLPPNVTVRDKTYQFERQD